MQNNLNIEKTKKSLIWAFTIIVFITILFVGDMFFSAKYMVFNDLKNEFPGKIIREMYPVNGRGQIHIEKIRLQDKLQLKKTNDYIRRDFLVDILLFLLLDLTFSALIYFIGTWFVNNVFKPVEKNFKDMNDFVHNAGHELKTPLSVIDSNIQLIKESKIYDEKMINELKDEIGKLSSLIDGLVNLDDIKNIDEIEKLDLKNETLNVLKNFEEQIKKKKLTVKTEIGDNILVQANKNYFYIFLSNIIGNAIKYNKNEGSIDINFTDGELSIKDSGIGIKKEELGKIFDRFYKTDISRNSSGYGIGLSLVKKIASIYNWQIDMESEEGNGSNFKIKF